MASVTGGPAIAGADDQIYAATSEPPALHPIVDLLAALAWAGWDRAPFTSASTSQVAVFEKPT